MLRHDSAEYDAPSVYVARVKRLFTHVLVNERLSARPKLNRLHVGVGM
jgi:hypothetical protein